MNINITGTVTATGNCTFNQGGTVEVDFGEVRFSSVTNALEGTYSQPLVSGMTCTGDVVGMTMVFNSMNSSTSILPDGHKGLTVGLDGSTSSSGLGIAFKVNGQVQDVGTTLAVDISDPPNLEAELVQTDIEKLLSSGQKISSSATLTMAFD
ncbi:fimbrial protein [Lelliottia nimipressuralis]